MDFKNTRPTNSRWKRDDTVESNPFRKPSGRFSDLKVPKENSRWKREDTSNNSLSDNRFRRDNRSDNRFHRDNRSDDRRDNRDNRRDNRFRSDNHRRRERRGWNRFSRRDFGDEKPKPKPFQMDTSDFPVLGKVDSQTENKVIGNWYEAALKGKDNPVTKLKKEKEINHQIVLNRIEDFGDDVNWSDEERKPNEINDIDQYDDDEYDDMDSRIF